MTQLPDFEGLAVLVKIVEEQSFAGAGRQLGVSAATVSRAVARLERRLGARLFNRSSRHVALTEFGRAIAERARSIYSAAEEMEGAARELSSQPRGVIRLAAPMTFGVSWVAPLLPDFLRTYPDLSVDLHLADDRVDIVAEGFDAALRIAAALEGASLVVRRLTSISRHIVASPAYIERRGLPKHPRELIPEDCLGYAYRIPRDVWHLKNSAGEEFSISPAGRLRVTNVEALLPTILTGFAIGELPDFVACPLIRARELVELLSDWKMAPAALYLVTPSMRARAAKVRVLAEFLSERLTRSTGTVAGK